LGAHGLGKFYDPFFDEQIEDALRVAYADAFLAKVVLQSTNNNWALRRNGGLEEIARNGLLDDISCVGLRVSPNGRGGESQSKDEMFDVHVIP